MIFIVSWPIWKLNKRISVIRPTTAGRKMKTNSLFQSGLRNFLTSIQSPNAFAMPFNFSMNVLTSSFVL